MNDCDYWTSGICCNPYVGKLEVENKTLKKINEQLFNVLELLITEIDVIEMSEDTPISDEAYGNAVRILRESGRLIKIE